MKNKCSNIIKKIIIMFSIICICFFIFSYTIFATAFQNNVIKEEINTFVNECENEESINNNDTKVINNENDKVKTDDTLDIKEKEKEIENGKEKEKEIENDNTRVRGQGNTETKYNQNIEQELSENSDNGRLIKDGKYIIKSVINEDYVFDIYNNSTASGANLEIWRSNQGENQKFDIKYLGNGEYSIFASYSNKSLDVEGNEKKSGTNVIQWASNNQDNQKWIIKEVEDGNYKIISKANNLCLDIPYGDIKSGANVQVWVENGGKNQMFKLELIDEKTNNNTSNDLVGTKSLEPGKYIIKSAINENYVFDIYDGLITSGANLELWKKNKDDNQIFELKYLGNGEYSIIALHSNRVLDVEDDSKEAGANVIQWVSNNQDNQKWIIKPVGNGYYRIISKSSKLCLDIPYGDAKSGANVQVWLENDGKNQMFKFESVSEQEINKKISGIKTVDDGMYCIRSLVDNISVLDIYNQSKENGANLEIWCNNSTLNQKFKLKYMNDGTYTILAVHSNKYLDVEGASKTSGTNVLQWEYNGNNNQRWIIKKVASSKYNIISKDSGLYLTVESGNVCIKEKNYTNSQYFSFNKTSIELESGYYGKSGLKIQGNPVGTDLKYYKYGSGPNVFFATFAIHGWEDDFEHDGIELTKMAERFKDKLVSMQDINIANKWTIYIFPSVNPDGEYYGWSHNGPGRTTLYSDAPEHKGIDMNRTWSTDWVNYTSDRNYTGTEPFQAFEARSLRDFLLSHKSTKGQTVLVDLHGWLNETMGDDGISSYYRSTLGMSKHISSYGRGYLINWARANLGSNGRTARTALIELPEAYSSADVENWGLADKYINATINMLRNI